MEGIREEALEIFMMIAAVAYLLWGFMEMIVSIVEEIRQYIK